MANVRLSEEKSRMLDAIMTELEIPVNQRAVALRLAFAKGIDSDNPINIHIKNGTGTEFPTSVINKGDNALLNKHLIINKLGHSIEEFNFNLLTLAVVERGIEDMYKEIQQLSDAETYLFYLLNKHQQKIVN